MAAEVRLGAPFWGFDGWAGRLYTRDARPRDYLRQYARVFGAVEGNTSFYHSPRPETVARWKAATPESFRFCFKFPRLVTHELALRHAKRETEAFLAAVAPLGPRLGPFLLQLPASFGPDALGDLVAFLSGLPADFRYAVELRHRAFFQTGGERIRVDAALREHGAERVIMDTRALRAGPANHPDLREVRHRKPNLPVHVNALSETPLVRWVGHPDDAVNASHLEAWAEVLVGWLRAGRSPYFFVHTPSNRHTPELARRFHDWLAERAKLPPLPPFPGERGETAAGQLRLV
ncbi:MAG: DUF72 domain-containing protein [Proteobacteria bacterium]|nr:DUF72 domain-containing protein [Pseudomonadota bacterium]